MAEGGAWLATADAGHFEATERGLIVHGEPTIDEWLAYGAQLKAVARAVYWIIGDWLAYGMATYDDWEQGVDGFDYGTLRNYKYVATHVPPENRRDPAELSFNHHYAVAKLPAESQPEWLERAYVGGWTPQRLRREIAQVEYSEADRCRDAIRRMRAALEDLLAHATPEIREDAAVLGAMLDDMEARL